MKTAQGQIYFCDTPKLMRRLFFFRDDVITHTILSVKGQSDGNGL